MQKITKSEKRAIRREWINYYLRGNKCLYVTTNNIRKMVRASERWLLSCEMKAYE